MTAHLTPAGTFLVEPQQPEAAERPGFGQEQLQQFPQTYRGPRGVTLTDEQDQNEDSFSDYGSESDEPPNETPRPRAEARNDIDLGRLRNRQSQSRPAQLRDHGAFEEGTHSLGTSNFNHQPSHAGGQAVPYSQNYSYHPQPVPYSTVSFPQHYPASPYPTSPYPTSPYPTNPYATNPYPSNLHPSNPYPTNHYPSNPGYPTGPYATNAYPANPYPTNTYDPYAASHYPVNPYAADPPFMPSPRVRPHAKSEPVMKHPHRSDDSEMNKVKRELKNLKMEDAARRHQEQDRRQMDEFWRKKEEEAALEKEAKRNFERLKRKKDLEAKAQQKKVTQARRDVADEEEIAAIIKRCVEKETREALEKVAAGRQREGKLRLEEVSREREKERLLVELIEFVDERRRQNGRSWDGGSVRDSLGGRGRSRMEVVPREFVFPTRRAPDLMRSEIEDIVLEVLQRRSLESEPPQTPSSSKQMFSSAWYDERPPLRTLQPRSYVSEPYDVDEGIRRSWEWERRGYSAKGTDPAAHGRSPELLSPSHTTVSDRYAPPESNSSIKSPKSSPGFRHEPTRKVSSRKSDPPQSRASRDGNRSYTSNANLHDIQEQSTREPGDDEFPFPSHARSEEPWRRPNRPQLDDTGQTSASLGQRRARAKLENEAGHSKRWATAAHLAGETEDSSSSESDAKELPPTRSSKYTYTPRKGSSSNRLVLDEGIPPAVPDPPPTKTGP
jgi:hypothetical protein